MYSCLTSIILDLLVFVVLYYVRVYIYMYTHSFMIFLFQINYATFIVFCFLCIVYFLHLLFDY